MFALLAAACGPLGAQEGATVGPAERARIVTSTTVFADLVRRVTGDLADVSSLVPAGANPHTHEPAPAEAITVARAHLYVANGLLYEYTPDRLVASARSKSLNVLILSEGMPTLDSQISHGDHGHLYKNPHLFLDVRNAMRYVERIRDVMVRVDAQHADRYRANAASYLAVLEDLDREVATQLAAVPADRRILFTDYNAFPYFAERYGLRAIAASYEGTAEVQPSPSQYAALVRQVSSLKVGVLFGVEGFSGRLLQQVARDTGARYVPGLHAATLGSTPDTDSYVGLMRANARLLVENLR